jgi:hypothetical protein
VLPHCSAFWLSNCFLKMSFIQRNIRNLPHSIRFRMTGGTERERKREEGFPGGNKRRNVPHCGNPGGLSRFRFD